MVADDAFSFLFAWELMSLASWALVMAHHRESGNAHAGYVYIIMASFSGLALLLCFGLLAGPTGSYAFDAMRAAHPSPGIAALALVLALIGAGSKAGVVPLHAWLPLAHPAAPSHVSALMSGVMTKVAVYGFVRIVFDLLGAPTWWSGIVVLVVGGITAVLGVLYALMEHDLKRLLAYHTVENIGIIFIGLGLALAFGANGLAGGGGARADRGAVPRVQPLGVQEPAVLRRRRRADRDRRARHGAPGRPDPSHAEDRVRVPGRLRGDLRAAAAERLRLRVADVPGDPAASRSAAMGLEDHDPGGWRAAGAVRGTRRRLLRQGVRHRPSSAGRARAAAADAREVDRCSLAAMFGFAALCLLAGIFPGVVIDLLAPVAQALTGAHMPTQLGVAWLSIVPVESARSSYNGLLVFLFIAVSASLTVLAIHRFASHALRRGAGLGLRLPRSAARRRSTPAAASPSRSAGCYGAVVFRTHETVTMPPPGDIAPARIEKHISDPIWDVFYAPVAGAVWRRSQVLNDLQFLTIRRYLGFVFAALVILLLALALWQ